MEILWDYPYYAPLRIGIQMDAPPAIPILVCVLIVRSTFYSKEMSPDHVHRIFLVDITHLQQLFSFLSTKLSSQ